jgi:RimJ/RimL family protein N-acetyltransferase
MPNEDLIIAKGVKVSLRRRTLDDIPLFLKWNKLIGEAQKYDSPWEKPEPDEEYIDRTTKSIQKETPDRVTVAVILDPDQRPIGTVNCYRDKGNPDHMYVGISIYEDALISKGLGTEALKLWIDFQFKSRNLHHIGLETWSFNQRMIRVAEKLGFRNEGCERELRKWNDEWLDKLHFGMLKTEWHLSEKEI